MRIITIVFAMTAGFIGGAIGSSFKTVYAQTPGEGIIHGREFVLLDAQGRKRGEWMVDSSDRGVIRMFDSKGSLIWDNGGGARLLSQ
jgi:hypothetical protein